MTLFDDKSIRFEEGEVIPSLPNHRLSSDCPLHYVMDFPVCAFLELELKIAKCGKRTTRYCCNAKERETTVPSICNSCILPKV